MKYFIIFSIFCLGYAIGDIVGIYFTNNFWLYTAREGFKTANYCRKKYWYVISEADYIAYNRYKREEQE